MFNVFKKLFGSTNEGEIRKLRPIVDKINSLEGEMKALTDEGMREKTREYQMRVQGGESLDSILPEAFALCREAAVRALGQRPFDVQLIGGIVLHQGRIAEMRTGEGKTLTAALPAFLNALTGKGVHIVTVNDYLARFHSEWMGKVYRFLGLSVGLVVHGMEPAQKQDAYAADVTYGTNNEFGFDYLRDNMVTYKERMVQRELNFAIVDEVDSILIDEARTPLIISGQGDKSTDLYARANQLVQNFREKTEEDGPGDFEKDEKEKHCTLTEEGVRKAERFFGIENITDPANTEIHHHVLAALRANFMMRRDVDYVVKDGQVVIVDEFTGRLMVGRRYSDGLHQAIEAKEHVKVERESKTLATITFQNYFRMYHKLSGMTGTAKTEEEEFQGIYNLDVVTIPTNRPMIRVDMNDSVYINKKAKYDAVVEEVVARHAKGQPVLVGTVSVEVSEMLGRMLDRRGVPHQVLNAKFHEKEAEIIAQAGKKGAVTIATNMAGRGTDILLGGNAEFMARRQMKLQGYEEQLVEDAIGYAENVPEEVLEARKVFHSLMEKFSQETRAGHDEVIRLGGLHIIGTERHESRRIDNQLRGRAGRQGDPGSSQFFISFEDDLMRLFGSDRFRPLLEKMDPNQEVRLEYKVVSRQIENAQKRVEARNYGIRKSVLQYDDVMNQQREIIYGQRRQVLEGEDMHEQVLTMRRTLIEEAVKRCAPDEAATDHWDVDGLSEYLEKLCIDMGGVRKALEECGAGVTREELCAALNERADKIYAVREKMWKDGGLDIREFERVALLRSVDTRWMDHIDAMDQLREGIGLRAYAQRDPIVEYKLEGFEMFDEMIRLIQEDTTRRLYFTVLNRQATERRQVAQPTQESHGEGPRRLSGGGAPASKTPVHAEKKVGRNDPCPCGSGKKYKNCCGKNISGEA